MLLHEFNWKKEVLESHEPVLVDFWANWCGPCRAMNPTLEALARDYKVCKVNVDTNQPLAARYGVSSIPALMIFKDGQMVASHVGVTPERTLSNPSSTMISLPSLSTTGLPSFIFLTKRVAWALIKYDPASSALNSAS